MRVRRPAKGPGALPVAVLGVDPGAAHLGWSILRGGAYVAAGTIEVDAMDFGSVTEAIRQLRGHASNHVVRHVAVERVERVNARPGFGSVMATGLAHGHGVGQRVLQAFYDDGLPVWEVAAETWHLEFFGQVAVKGDAVSALLAHLVKGWPAPRSRGVDGHTRDAGGVALWLTRQLDEQPNP